MKQFKNKQNEKVVLQDGRQFFISRSVATSTLLVFNIGGVNYIPLVKRGNAVSHCGKYAYVSGYLDYNETIEQCAIREIYEELGIDLENILINEPDNVIINGFKNFYVNSDPNSFLQNVSFRYKFYIKQKDFLELKKPDHKECDEIFYATEDFIHANKNNFAFNHYEIINNFLTEIKQ